jgi:DNA-binding transcriptional ArsR family regulator
VSAPLYQAKAEFFKTLSHPVRIRVLELLAERDHAVAELLPQVGIEAAHLSQQLAVLRRMNLVVARREGSTVCYSLVSPRVAELLTVARRILSEVLASQACLLDDLRAAEQEPTAAEETTAQALPVGDSSARPVSGSNRLASSGATSRTMTSSVGHTSPRSR